MASTDLYWASQAFEAVAWQQWRGGPAAVTVLGRAQPNRHPVRRSRRTFRCVPNVKWRCLRKASWLLTLRM